MRFMMGMFIVLFGSLLPAMSLAGSGDPVSIDNYQCLAWGDWDARDHMRELKLAHQYRDVKDDLVPWAALLVLSEELRRIGWSHSGPYASMHTRSEEYARRLAQVAQTRDSEAALYAGEAWLRDIAIAYAAADMRCPAASEPVAETLPDVSEPAVAEPDPEPTSSDEPEGLPDPADVVAQLQANWDSPTKMTEILKVPDNWKALEESGKLLDVVHMYVDRVIDRQIEILRVAKDAGESSVERYESAIQVFEDALFVSDKAESEYGKTRLHRGIEVWESRIAELEAEADAAE